MGCNSSKNNIENTFTNDIDSISYDLKLNNSINKEINIYYYYCCFLLITIIFLNIYYYLQYEEVYSNFKKKYNKINYNLSDEKLIDIDYETENIIVDDLSKYEFQNTLKIDYENETNSQNAISNDDSTINTITTENNEYLLNINIYVDCDKYSISLLEKLITSYFQNDTNMTKNNTYIKLYGDWNNKDDKMFDNIFDCEFTNIYKYNKKNENNNTKMMLDLMEDACLGNTMKIYLITNDGSFLHLLEKIKNDFSHVELVLPWRPYISKKIKAYVNLRE